MSTRIANSRTRITFSGTAGAVAQAFATPLHNYAAGGETRIANVDDPQIPTALAGVVRSIAGLHTIKYRPGAPYDAAANCPCGAARHSTASHQLSADRRLHLLRISRGFRQDLRPAGVGHQRQRAKYRDSRSCARLRCGRHQFHVAVRRHLQRAHGDRAAGRHRSGSAGDDVQHQRIDGHLQQPERCGGRSRRGDARCTACRQCRAGRHAQIDRERRHRQRLPT